MRYTAEIVKYPDGNYVGSLRDGTGSVINYPVQEKTLVEALKSLMDRLAYEIAGNNGEEVKIRIATRKFL
jgi:hypothetical protein